MTVQCITCTHVDTKRNPAMARLGLPACDLDSRSYRTVSLTHQRECHRHKSVTRAEEDKRRIWWAKQ